MSTLSLPGHRPVLADHIPGSLTRDAALVVGGAAFTGLAAQIAFPVPGSPVPVTFQTLAALLVGTSLGWKRGGASMLVYLLAGMAGVPWFTGATSGIHTASLGYVVGYVFAGALVGAVAARGGDRTPLRTAGTMALGNVVIYAVGVPWLMTAASLDLAGGLTKGVAPFVIGDAVKIVIAAGLLPAAWALVRKVRKQD